MRFCDARATVARALLLVLASFLVVPSAQGVEQVEEFLQGLRERGYFEVALDYMDAMKDSPLASDEFKKNLPYERGVTLVDLARVTGDPQLREEHLVIGLGVEVMDVDVTDHTFMIDDEEGAFGITLISEHTVLMCDLPMRPKITEQGVADVAEALRPCFQNGHMVDADAGPGHSIPRT